MKEYYQEKLALLNIQDQILTIGTEIFVSNLVDQAGHIDFEKLSSVLKAYEDAKKDIRREREIAGDQLRLLENVRNMEYNEKGGEKNDSESV